MFEFEFEDSDPRKSGLYLEKSGSK